MPPLILVAAGILGGAALLRLAVRETAASTASLMPRAGGCRAGAHAEAAPRSRHRDLPAGLDPDRMSHPCRRTSLMVMMQSAAMMRAATRT
jgi:hypothetical protein